MHGLVTLISVGACLLDKSKSTYTIRTNEWLFHFYRVLLNSREDQLTAKRGYERSIFADFSSTRDLKVSGSTDKTYEQEARSKSLATHLIHI